MDKVRVAVRVRPMNRRELDLKTRCVVDMDKNQTILRHPRDSGDEGKNRKQPKTFAYDHCFWSMEEKNPKFAAQEEVFKSLGRDILERAFEGYNGCIFAYGQTGSGKSYTMMGTMEQKGIIPRLCDSMFDQIAEITDPDHCCKVEVSYMEIYNEKVHDLLDPKGVKNNLKVREHNILGPYVDGLSQLVVSSFEDINNLMNEGNKSRTVAATNMNSESSRSHGVFNIILTQSIAHSIADTSVSGEKVSKLSLVDLAGSERAQKTGAVGDRLKEGSNINKSLTTLGLVISALAEQAAGKNHKGKFVPYRDSVLTWLLKDNLGGNSKTVMVATISPAADNYEETLSTLRYADRAKRIVNHAVINEDPNARIIRELRDEVDQLRKQLADAKYEKRDGIDIQDRLEESEKLIKERSKTWEEKQAERERIDQERHALYEQMGISVETSGIKVGHGKFFLVNLNADPSLNELLVYYLKEHTLVGGPDAPVQQDIQLNGLGIMPEHCVVNIENNEVFLTPKENSRTCVNGSVISQKTKVKHGDRILWGFNHFFRINCPKTNSPQTTEPENSDGDQTIDFDFAQQELMMKELSNSPLDVAIQSLEKQYEDDKQEALELQKQMYERQMQSLRNQLMSPSTPSLPFLQFDQMRLTPTSNATQSSIQRKYQEWAQEREKEFKQSLVKLRKEVLKAKAFVQEANFLAQEMGKQTEFSVTLQIPASNLSPNRRKDSLVSEPAILVNRRKRGSQVWTMEKFENKMIDMKEMYEERKASGLPLRVDDSESDDLSDSEWGIVDDLLTLVTLWSDLLTPDLRFFSEYEDFCEFYFKNDEGPPRKGDPFYESQENHNLIGVANIFLTCLFHDVKLDYHVPIISQHGEVSGKLHVSVSKLGSVMDRFADAGTNEYEDDFLEYSSCAPTPIIVKISIHEARGLPLALSNFVFCQYSFWGQSEAIVVPPEINPESLGKKKSDGAYFDFNHTRDFKVYLTEEFIEHISEGALSIEVWGHRSPGFGMNGGPRDIMQLKSRSLTDRWTEVMRRIEVWVEIHELNDQGEYQPVEVTPKPEVPSGGVFQLLQGHSRRITVRLKPITKSGTLPLICESISSLSVGCICIRSKLQKGLDSYQEEDLTVLRESWLDVLNRRKDYLDEQIQKLISKTDKSDADADRERALIEQWACLTDEREALYAPHPGSSVPGAPADWDVSPEMEEHRPVLFLDLNADDMSTPNAKEGLQAAGINSILPKEHSSQFVNLPLIKQYTEKENVCAVAAWDSSMHDSSHLNRVTTSNERVYLIMKAVVRLSHPAYMELVLRKRLCINIYKKGLYSYTDRLKKRLTRSDIYLASGVTYDVVSNIPKASRDLEDMETLAQMAASQDDAHTPDGETYIEKYIRGVSAVESILTLDRLRQEVTVKELLAASGRSLKKTTSVPNIHQISFSSPGFSSQQFRSDSIQDLSLQELTTSKSATSFPARPNFLNLKSHTSSGYSAKLSSKIALSPMSAKLGIKPLPMRTLVEEQFNKEKKPLLNHDTEEEFDEEEELKHQHQVEKDPHSIGSDDFQDFESYESQQLASQNEDVKTTTIPHSSTADSIAEMQVKSFTPSMTSSGYDSQAVSTLTLSSEDSLSTKSNEDVDLKDIGKKNQKSKSLEQGSSEEDDHHDNVRKNKTDVVPDSKKDEFHEKAIKCDLNDDSKNLDLSVELHISENDLSVSEEKDIDKSVNKSFLSNKTDSSGSGRDNYFSMADLDSSVSFNESAMEKDPDWDPYSETAMEELERLGENDSGDISIDNDVTSERVKNKFEKVLDSKKIENIEELKIDNVIKRDGLRKGERPVSCILSPQSDPMFDSLGRNGLLHTSDDHLSTTDDALSVCSFGSRADLDRVPDGPIPSWVKVGESVIVTSSRGPSKTGVVQFVGSAEFAPGVWVGVELDLPEGKNDGTVQGTRYFKCRNRHGIFVRPDKLIWHKSRRSTRKSNVQRRTSLPMNGTTTTTTPTSGVPRSSSFMTPTASSSAKKK